LSVSQKGVCFGAEGLKQLSSKLSQKQLGEEAEDDKA